MTTPPHTSARQPTPAMIKSRLLLCPAISAASRVVAGVDLAEALLGDVRVDLGRRDVRVAQHHLHGAQVGAMHQQVRGEGVTERMRRDVRPYARDLRVALDAIPE